MGVRTLSYSCLAAVFLLFTAASVGMADTSISILPPEPPSLDLPLPLIILESLSLPGGGKYGYEQFVEYTVINPFENAGDPNDPGALSYPAVAFGVETAFAGGYVAWGQDPSWEGALLTREMWDGDPFIAGDGFAFGVVEGNSDPNPDDRPYRTDDYGSWDQNFGIQAAQVAFYFDNEGVAQSLEPGMTFSGFSWAAPGATVSSSTVSIVQIVDQYGNVLGTTSKGGVSGIAVPLPAAAWMGLGMLGLLAACRRRRNPR